MQVEPSGALGGFLASLRSPPTYPIALDRDGRLADGYEVEGLPWLMVVFGFVIFFNLLADLSYAWLDPRIRLD